MNKENSNISQVQKLIQDEELLDQTFEQINKDISKALLEMKKENQESKKNEKFFSENIFSNELGINNKDYNENNILNQNIFNHFNDYKNNNNYYNGNIFPNYYFSRYNNNITSNINNNDNYMKENNFPINNFILNSPIYNINIINYNKNNKNNNYNNYNNNNNCNKNKKKNKKILNQNKIVSCRGDSGLLNLDFCKNIINIENILQMKDNRTTLIIRNIPNKYDILLLLKELNLNFENKFDIVYLPFDVKNNLNLGFGFINFINPIHILLFYEEFMGKKWNWSNSSKRSYLVYSNYQGKKELVEYIFKKLGIKDLTNNNINEKIKKSFFINNMKNLKAPMEIPLKYYGYFVNHYPLCLCHSKDDKVFVFDI